MTEAPLTRKQLALTALVRLTVGLLLLLAILLLPAGTATYWQAWVYATIVFAPMTAFLAYLLLNNPRLLERRLRSKETDKQQGLIVRFGTVSFLITLLLSGVDHRFGWSAVPVAVVLAADVVVLLGYAIFVLVLRENDHASRVVEVEHGQHVVDTGPYAIVRHPMYTGVIAMTLATPVALGSWWALLPALPMVAVMTARIRNEERLLTEHLAGYAQYALKTKFRLIPRLW